MLYLQLSENVYVPANWFTEEGLKGFLRFGFKTVKMA